MSELIFNVLICMYIDMFKKIKLINLPMIFLLFSRIRFSEQCRLYTEREPGGNDQAMVCTRATAE